MAAFTDLVSLVSNAIATHAERPLFGTEHDGAWAWMTYGELGRRVDRMRAALARLGVRRGDRVAIISGNRPEWAVVVAAAHGLGAVCVPMYEVQLEKDWEYILR